jgi:hypothetical protein
MNDLSKLDYKTLTEDARDFRANKAYEILYEKKSPSIIDLEFLMFWAKAFENPKLKKLVRKHPEWKKKKK